MAGDLEAAVAELEKRADSLCKLLSYAPRAFVIEFAGTPKSGKSTSVEAIRHFLGRHGFRVHVLTERAALCPIPMKGHLFFNTWCATSMLSELLANVEAETDIIIVDRGLFDALVWLLLQEKRGELNASEARTIEAFLLLDRWRTLIDLAVVMNVSGEEALERETKDRLSRKPGSIMNPDVLAALVEAVDEASDRYGPRFRAIIRHRTTGQEVRVSHAQLTDQLLTCLEAFLNPEILVVPRAAVEKLPLASGGAHGDSAVQAALTAILDSCRFMRRDEAESSSDYIQVVASGILTRGDRIFLFQRKENDPKYRLYGKTTIWQGCHISRRDTSSAMADLLKDSLLERVSRSLSLSRVFPVRPLGYCWDKDEPKSSRHFGVMFSIEIDNPHTEADLRRKEFRKQRGHGLTGEFYTRADLLSRQAELRLESWSRAVLGWKAGGE